MPLPAPFALGTFSDQQREPFPGLVVDDRVLDLRGALDPGPHSVQVLLQNWQRVLPELRELAHDDARDWRAIGDLRVHAPVQPRQIFQTGANYRRHVIDLELAHRSPDDPRSPEQARAEIAEVMDRRAADGVPYVFIGLPGAITGPYDDVVLPSWCAKPDWELELAAVIGEPAYRITPAQSLAHVAGYTIANDLTDRASVFRSDMPAIGTDWLRAKNAPGFTPIGPYLVPAEFVDDPSDLRLTLRLNGEIKQDESTSDMLFDLTRVISYVSQTARLLPGDLVLTGSPAGNGMHWGRLLRSGDVMESTISGLGAQRTRCVAEEQR